MDRNKEHNEEAFEYAIEEAYWKFDAKRKGNGNWRSNPQTERDAFKQEMRNIYHRKFIKVAIVENPELHDEIYRRIRSLIVLHLGVKPTEVIPTARFIEDLGADSLDTVEMVMGLEEEFEFEIPDEHAEKFLCVNDAYMYIKNRINSQDTVMT